MKKTKKIDRLIEKLTKLVDEEEVYNSAFIKSAILSLKAHQHAQESEYNEAVISAAELIKIVEVTALGIISDIVDDDGIQPTMIPEWRYKN